ncbi:MAG: CDP-alcohol phosphatidyltransferase family protein [Chlamydiota bacterium]
MIEGYLRDSFEKRFIQPLLERSWTQNYSSNSLTLLGAFFGILAAIAIFFERSYLGCFLLLVSGYFDMFDGSHARKTNQSSPLGTVLDIFCDRVVEFLILFALFLVQPVDRGIPFFALLGSCFLCVTSFLVVGIFSKNESKKSFYYSPGLIERGEAFLFFMMMALFPSFALVLAWILTGLILITTAIRLREFFLQANSLL